MATPADQRLLDILDKWLNSLALHVKYASLDEDGYSIVQPWPKHQRPSRWIIELARQKAAALKIQVEERVKMGDVKFSDSLELMGFLANLVGADHIERFIPLANADTERAAAPAPADSQSPSRPNAAVTGTREMPKFIVGKERRREAAGTAGVARAERKAAAKPAGESRGAGPKAAPPKTAAPGAAAARAAPIEAAASNLSADAMHEQVIADAARLVQWGRKWYELAELISSMADRPSLIDVRRILKDNKTVIDKKAGRG